MREVFPCCDIKCMGTCYKPFCFFACFHNCVTLGFKHIEAEPNGRHFADDIFKCIFLNESVWISIKILLKSVPKGPINNIPAMVQIMAWRRPGDKPLSEPMMDCLPTHICVIRPQWVNRCQFWSLGIVVGCVLSVRVSTCPCVRPCINTEIVFATTRHPFKVKSPNLV